MKRGFGWPALLGCGLCLGLLLTQSHASGQKRSGRGRTKTTATAIQEEKGTPAAVSAPPECAQLVRDFVAYISHEKPDIASDKQAQGRWLSAELRKALDHRQTAYNDYAKKNPDSPEGPPGNGDFVGSWDYPTSYGIAGSRLYNNRALVDVIFKWGPKTQYPGDSRLVSYVLIRDGSGWKIEDIYTYRGEFNETGSLMQTFNSNDYP